MTNTPDAAASPVRVLVIDDEKGLRDMLSYTLRRLKFEVEAAEDGEKGLEAALNGGFDVVVCDVMMPGMNGLEVLEALRRAKTSVEVILVTGYPTPETAARAAELGAFDCLAKPYDLMALGVLLKEAARRKRGL